MDTVCDKKRVSDSISCASQIGQSSSSVFEETSSRSREDSTPSRGDRIYTGEACHRTSFFTSSEGRLLHPIISGSEKVQRMETSDRSFQIEPVHLYSSFQNGDYRLSSSCITEEWLGHISRFKGCILSHSHPSQVQEVSPLPFYGENLPISSASVWALPSSLYLHQSRENGSEALSSPGNAFACIPGRLAPTFNLPVPVHSTPGSVTAYGFEPGICPELGQIRANSQSNVLFPGCSNRSGEGYDRTFSGQDSEIANNNTEDVGISFSICPGSSFCTRTDGICGPSPPLWPGSQAFTTMACERPVVSGNPVLGLPYFTGSLVQTSSRAMAEQGFSSCYGSAGSSTTRLLSVHGCESGGLGRPSGRSLSFKPVVCSVAQRTHKCSGTPSSLVSSEVHSSGNFRLQGVAVNKHNCGGLSEQRRGGQVSNLVVHGNQAASMVCETTGVSDSQIRSKQTERTCRFALKEGADHSYRVDSPQGHSVSDFSLLGSPTHRSVCHETKQSTTNLCVSISWPLSLGSGCDVPVLGGNVSTSPFFWRCYWKWRKRLVWSFW